MFVIRDYRSEDCRCLAELFYDTVHHVNVKDYTKEQLNVWADGHVNLEKWDTTFLEHYSVVAVESGQIVGFGDMDKQGYLDRLFVHKDWQRKRIATAICDVLEKSVETAEYSTDASITAKPFFEKRGYRVIKENAVVRRGIILTNYTMKKCSERKLSSSFAP